MSLEKTATEIRSYVKESQSARYVIPALALGLPALAGAYALAPRSSDNRAGPGQHFAEAKERMRSAGAITKDMLKSMWDNKTTDYDKMSPIDRARLQLNMLREQLGTAVRPARVGLEDLRAQLRDFGVPTAPGNLMDRGVDRLSSLFSNK